jgi:hypothetical protein
MELKDGPLNLSLTGPPSTKMIPIRPKTPEERKNTGEQKIPGGITVCYDMAGIPFSSLTAPKMN